MSDPPQVHFRSFEDPQHGFPAFFVYRNAYPWLSCIFRPFQVFFTSISGLSQVYHRSLSGHFEVHPKAFRHCSFIARPSQVHRKAFLHSSPIPRLSGFHPEPIWSTPGPSQVHRRICISVCFAFLVRTLFLYGHFNFLWRSSFAHHSCMSISVSLVFFVRTLFVRGTGI